jgi:hypothetical protein
MKDSNHFHTGKIVGRKPMDLPKLFLIRSSGSRIVAILWAFRLIPQIQMGRVSVGTIEASVAHPERTRLGVSLQSKKEQYHPSTKIKHSATVYKNKKKFHLYCNIQIHNIIFLIRLNIYADPLYQQDSRENLNLNGGRVWR